MVEAIFPDIELYLGTKCYNSYEKTIAKNIYCPYIYFKSKEKIYYVLYILAYKIAQWEKFTREKLS